MKNISKQELAQTGESLAADFLVTNGYKVLCRNFRVKQGEIDLIVEKDQQLIFVEVKTRSYHSIQSALENVSHKKQTHISNVAQVYCKQNPEFGKYNTRFDVIVVLFDAATGSYNISHYPDAFLPVFE
jgi:putative endonuclease